MTDCYRITLESGPADTPAGAVSTLRLAGEFDMAARDQLRDAVIGAVTADRALGVLVDLGEVTFLDSESLGALIDGYLAAERTGRSFRLINATGLVRRILTLTGMLDLSAPGGAEPPAVPAPRPAPAGDTVVSINCPAGPAGG